MASLIVGSGFPGGSDDHRIGVALIAQKSFKRVAEFQLSVCVGRSHAYKNLRGCH
jgi:hypothetical protein